MSVRRQTEVDALFEQEALRLGWRVSHYQPDDSVELDHSVIAWKPQTIGFEVDETITVGTLRDGRVRAHRQVTDRSGPLHLITELDNINPGHLLEALRKYAQ